MTSLGTHNISGASLGAHDLSSPSWSVDVPSIPALGGSQVSAAGTVSISGAALPRLISRVASAGSFAISGQPVGAVFSRVAAAGNMSVAGQAAGAGLSSVSAAGTLEISGAAEVAGDTVSASGTISITGSANAGLTSSVAAANSINVTGAAVPRLISSVSASGVLDISGAAVSGFVSEVSSSGVINLNGAATAGLISSAGTAGTVNLSGAAVAGLNASVNATGTVDLSGASVAALNSSVSAAGTVDLSGAATVVAGGGGLPTPVDITAGGSAYMSRGADLTGASNASNGVSFFFEGTINNSNDLIRNESIAIRMRVQANKFETVVRDSSNNVLFNVKSLTNVTTGSTVKIWFGYDAVNDLGYIYLDTGSGAADDSDVTGNTAGTDIGITDTDWHIFHNGDGFRVFNGTFKKMRLWQTFLDPSSTSDRADMEDDNDTHGAIIALQGLTETNAGTNQGSGGDMTVTGTFT